MHKMSDTLCNVPSSVGTATYYTRLAEILCSLIRKRRSVVYVDFKDIAHMAIALRERGISSSSYHGKNMSSHDSQYHPQLVP